MLAAAPAALTTTVEGLSDQQLDTPYREGGWTARQVVHHLADAHLLYVVRVRVALTEDHPAVIGFDEARWAEPDDARIGPVLPSLQLFAAAHGRLDWLLRSLRPDDFAKTIRHPSLGTVSVDALMDIYAWHARHHTAQIAALRAREAW